MPRKLAAFIAQLSVPLLLLFALALPGVPQTQDPAAPSQRPRKVFPKEEEAEDVLRFDTDLVSVDVTAIDTEGRPVKNLRQEDFKLYSDGVERPISFFQIEQRPGEPRPLAVVFALDAQPAPHPAHSRSHTRGKQAPARLRSAILALAPGTLHSRALLANPSRWRSGQCGERSVRPFGGQARRLTLKCMDRPAAPVPQPTRGTRGLRINVGR